MALTKAELKALAEVSNKLEVNPYWLYSLINFESKWNPKASNPYSSAKGLIQFMDATAKGLGYRDSQDLINTNPTIESQLRNPVYNYLKKYKPFPTKQNLYMSVFYPIARSWPVNAYFPQNVIASNPGIDTVQSYIDKVEKKNLQMPFFVVFGMSLIIFLFINTKHKHRMKGV